MGFRGLFEGWHLIILILLVVLLFGAKRLPDAARSLGRSMRVFKSEVDEMKAEGKDTKPSSPAASSTVPGETVPGEDPLTPRETRAQSPIHEDVPRTDNRA